MANFMDDSIDMKIFMAIRACEVSSKVLGSHIQPLLMSGPGMGKSTAVRLYAESCGYELVVLKGNSTEPGIVQGFDCAPTDTSKESSTKHLRPTWYQEVLDNDALGKKTLLFLDEISTANEYVQAALLHLVLERKCGTESLPSSTLIVSAANYSSNLSNSMTLLAPFLNRFVIINIIPTVDDISQFLSRYKGAMSGDYSSLEDKAKSLIATLDSNIRKDLIGDISKVRKIAEVFEGYLLDEVKALGSEGLFNPAVGNLKDLYVEVEDDQSLPGFITGRTLDFFCDLSVSCYVAFGKEGLETENFKNMALGLVGQALSYNSSKRVVKTDVTDRFCKAVLDAAIESERLNNGKISEYSEFIAETLNGDKSKLLGTIEKCNLISNKINDLMSDPYLIGVERPLSEEVLKSISKEISSILSKSIKEDTDVDKVIISSVCSNGSESLSNIDPQKFIGRVVEWNSVCSLMKSLHNVVVKEEYGYPIDTYNTIVVKTKKSCREYLTRLKSLCKVLSKLPGIGGLIPAINTDMA